MDMVYIDIVLLIILCFLTIFMCGYGVYCVYRLVISMQMQILLRPTRVMFSHKKEGQTAEELRTVVAYQNPFTGDYCVHKSRVGPKGYVNSLGEESPDSGVSDEYEPLSIDPQVPGKPGLHPPRLYRLQDGDGMDRVDQQDDLIKLPLKPTLDDNSVNKTWNWNYKEYQI